jgi:hypothetical protein
MNPTRSASLPPARRLLLLPGLLLLFGLVAGGVHDHAREIGSHACAICTLSHTTATAPATGIEPAPGPRVERVTLVPASAPHAVSLLAPSSRAPPSL